MSADLLAIATVRRLLLELGYVMQPDDGHARVGALTLWVALAREDLGGLSPAQALALPDGERRVLTCLRAMIQAAATSGADPVVLPADAGTPSTRP